MGNFDQKEGVSGYSFLQAPDAQEAVAPIDYAFRNGEHIQLHGKQEFMFRFIESNYESIKTYYRDFYGASVESDGESINKYFYIEILPESRGQIPYFNRYPLPNEYVIIGFLLYKIVFIDGFIELDSISAFQRIVRQDYEELKPGLYRILARVKKPTPTELDDEKVDTIIEKALKEFNKIGWVDLEDDRFEILPSFQRLVKLYGDYINDPKLWDKEDPQS